jgi:hypothetical protein
VTRPTYSIRIDGVDALDLPVALMRDLCDILLDGASRAAHLNMQHSDFSTARKGSPRSSTASC